MVNEPVHLQSGHGDGHTRTVDAEHVREDVARQVTLVGLDPIANGEQPFRQPMLAGVEPFADEVPGDLLDEQAREGEKGGNATFSGGRKLLIPIGCGGRI